MGREAKGHKCESVPWTSWLQNGNQLCTSGTYEDGTNETILWDTKAPRHLDPAQWTILFKIHERFNLVFDYSKTLVGCIHDYQFKVWNKNLIADMIMSYARTGGEVKEMEEKIIQYAAAQ